LRSFAVPTSREGGIWAPSGGTVDDGRLLYAVGNGESTQAYDHSDSVLSLSRRSGSKDRPDERDVGGQITSRVLEAGTCELEIPIGQHAAVQQEHWKFTDALPRRTSFA